MSKNTPFNAALTRRFHNKCLDDEHGPKTSKPSDLAVTWEDGPDMPERRTQTTAVALDG